MLGFDPQAYGPVFAPLLNIDRRRPLDAGAANRGARSELALLSLETVFAHTRVLDRDMASCCIAGAWLLHDFLDESHAISQSIETPSGSFWHAIMHRREGDFSNAKYWLRRVGRHPVVAHVDESLRDSNSRLGETRPRGASVWDPLALWTGAKRHSVPTEQTASCASMFSRSNGSCCSIIAMLRPSVRDALALPRYWALAVRRQKSILVNSFAATPHHSQSTASRRTRNTKGATNVTFRS